MLRDQRGDATELIHLESMGEAETYLATQLVDIIVLDLGLFDAEGSDAVRRVHAVAPRIPLVVLTGLDDEAMVAQTLREGAQGYLIKGQIDPRGLFRALRNDRYFTDRIW